MKNLELLPLSAESKKRIEEFARQYQRYGHITVEIVSYSEGRLIVRAEQKDLINGKFLSKKNLLNVYVKCLKEKYQRNGNLRSLPSTSTAKT